MFDFLNNPILFNIAREVLAGKQENTKKFIRDNIKKYKCHNIIDICCGTGGFADCVKEGKYLGVDNSNDYIKFAQKKYSGNKNRKFIVQDVLTNGLKITSRFDCALLISTLHHFSDQELDIIFRQLKRNVKGVLIIADLDANPPGLLRKILVQLDRGRFIRSNTEKLSLLKKYFKVLATKTIPSRLAVQCGIVCRI